MLRNSLLTLLFEYRVGPKAIITQLSIALADLAIQLSSWQDPVSYMIDALSTNSEMVNVLLEFLCVLPEELKGNRKLHFDSSVALGREEQLLNSSSTKVVQLMLSYLAMARISLIYLGDNKEILCQILECVNSWLHAGSISVSMLLESPIVDIAFELFESDELMDVCVDIICEVVLIASKPPRSPQLLEKVYPKLQPMIAIISEKGYDDPDRMRGICRILVETGEGFPDLFLTNYASFQPILNGMLVCAACEDLDIARITFNVWYLLSEELKKSENTTKVPFKAVFEQLVSVVIKHLQYPADLDSWRASERDEFREFRHIIGDVLKDCLQVLGEDALSIPVNQLTAYFSNGLAVGSPILDPNVSWQQIEAPLFSLRAMCRRVSLDESNYMPQIMMMLPRLPEHPKLKYAAVLVIGRYAEWTNYHPDLLSYQLDFVSKGFEGGKANFTACAQTFRDLCKYCSAVIVT